MSTLNILCTICSEYFKNTDVIYSTCCGHVFHKLCLFQWLKRSNTCPQCRKHCFIAKCHQLYVNFVEASFGDSEPEMKFPKTYDWLYVDQYMDLNDMSFGFKFGMDERGNDIYAARGRLNGDLIPGYYVPSKGMVIVPWGFQSHCLTEDIELLDISNDDAEYKWIAASDGDIPENAFTSGITVLGDVLYTARAKHNSKMLYGKLHQRYYLAYMPYKNKEVSYSQYEILVRIPKNLTATAPMPDEAEENDEELFT